MMPGGDNRASPHACSWKVGAWEPFTDGVPGARTLPTPPHLKGSGWPGTNLVEGYSGMWRGKAPKQRRGSKKKDREAKHAANAKPNLPPIGAPHPGQRAAKPAEVSDVNSTMFPTVGRDGIYTAGLKRLLQASKRTGLMPGYTKSRTSLATSIPVLNPNQRGGGSVVDDVSEVSTTAASLLKKIENSERKNHVRKAKCAKDREAKRERHAVAVAVGGQSEAQNRIAPRGSMLFSPFPVINAGPQLPALFSRTRVHHYHGRAYACE
eukprot:TRINITY_DN6359_c0_g1_i1.p1 TRINITY_DN6359_c0_g1~~TRINITY_DN6359_c0_g1_i1.p1  ORF type:complete len:265 (+),score=47.55 TRINITY_DN6359_c0_g1_i1:60-854(+)